MHRALAKRRKTLARARKAAGALTVTNGQILSTNRRNEVQDRSIVILTETRRPGKHPLPMSERSKPRRATQSSALPPQMFLASHRVATKRTKLIGSVTFHHSKPSPRDISTSKDSKLMHVLLRKIPSPSSRSAAVRLPSDIPAPRGLMRTPKRSPPSFPNLVLNIGKNAQRAREQSNAARSRPKPRRSHMEVKTL